MLDQLNGHRVPREAVNSSILPVSAEAKRPDHAKFRHYRISTEGRNLRRQNHGMGSARPMNSWSLIGFNPFTVSYCRKAAALNNERLIGALNIITEVECRQNQT